MEKYQLTLKDQDGKITLSRQDLLNYTGPANLIAATLMIRLCHHTFSLLSPGQPVERRKLYWTLGFPGEGILDCVELVSHAVREGRCLQKPELYHPEAPMSLGGQFVFDITYREKTVRIWPSADVFDDEFRDQVSRWQEQAPSKERQKYLHYKQSKAKQILEEPAESLFQYQWLKQ